MLEFSINSDLFVALFGVYLVFFLVLWTVSYVIKVIR